MPIMKMPTALAALALLAAPSLAADRQATPAKDAAPTGNLDTATGNSIMSLLCELHVSKLPRAIELAWQLLHERQLRETTEQNTN